MIEKEPENYTCPGCGVALCAVISSEAYKEKKDNKTRTAEDVRKALPPEIVNDVTIVEKESTYRIVPKKFLGKDNFREIMKTVNDLRGKWVSQGKTSYWWVSKTAVEKL